MKRFQTIVGTDLNEAAAFLEKDELVAIPTETVYGLAANAFSPKAIEQVFRVKQRPHNNPLIVHVDRIAEVRQLVQEIPETAEALIEHFSPGPLTLLLKKNAFLPGIVTAGRAEVAVRIPAQRLTLELLQRIDFPLVAPSANRYSTISPTHPEHVVKNFYGEIPYVLDGGYCDVGIESTIVGFDSDDTPIIYRQGAITPEEIELVTGKVRIKNADGSFIAPGLSPHHYAPKTPLYLVDRFAPLRHYDVRRTGLLCFNRYYADLPPQNQFVLSPTGDLREAAKNLYRGLHYLDDLGMEVLIAERCPMVGLGLAINDRLRRAASTVTTSQTKMTF